LEEEIKKLIKVINHNKNHKANIIRNKLNLSYHSQPINNENDILLGNKILVELKNENKILNYQFQKYKTDLNTLTVIFV
jgi:hypothetical protein